MFTLFKKRLFGDYVSDTFQFFKTTGKHYFQNYLTLCGGLLMVLVILSYFFFKVYFDFILNSDSTGNDASRLFNYLSGNSSWVFIGIAFAVLLMLLLHLLNVSVPLIYMELYDKNHGSNFGTKEILAKFKSNFARIFLFFLGVIFIVTPSIVLFFGAITYFLVKFISIPITLLIGLPVLLFLIPTLFCWTVLGFFEFLNHKKSFFEALADGFRHLRNQYFPIVGSAMIIYTIIQVTMTFFSIISYAIAAAAFFTSTQNQKEDGLSFLGIIMTIVMIFSLLTGFILSNLLMVNQGLVYYSRKEYDENISSQDSIDLIGSE